MKLLILSVAITGVVFAQTPDLELGRKLYTGHCGHCHGLGGEGGRGSALNTGQFRHGGSDAELYGVIRNGIANTEMRGTNLPDLEVQRIVAFVKELGGRRTSDTTTGDAGAGAAVYQARGCARCHTINGQGGFLGPDLSGIGARRAVRHLRESVVNPNTDLPLDYRMVVVVTASGSTVSGIHLNEDEYAIHLRDVSGNLRTFLKREIKEVRLPRQSIMPPYALPETELENLIAYLTSLKPMRSNANR